MMHVNATTVALTYLPFMALPSCLHAPPLRTHQLITAISGIKRRSGVRTVYFADSRLTLSVWRLITGIKVESRLGSRGVFTMLGVAMGPLPSFRLEGQTALVTGAARGLGRAIALALAEAGADVAVGLRDVNQDAGVAAEIEAFGRKALPIQMDISNLDQIRQAIHAVAAHWGKLDILVNNTGVAPTNLALGRARGRLRPHTQHQSQGHFLRVPGSRRGHEAAGRRTHHQYEFASRFCRPADRVGLFA